ncbi:MULTISPECIES: MarR family winged helix-turn-helix transcriptional regulator [Arthrobacter]|uniref:MarR family winged helix-turn-helix transcriptional regulator n=1 Tax=Arthrobacter TaxID=1663 RepID=UPI001D15A42A|nr:MULTISPECIES: MarR family transcriptional regulator [Arthrobacter]MCC3283655.1 MarR family transcriptional regulator [Arthrobacter caoxuetaonis]MCC9193093.1 MarR family transcriptional regulator [Arthrobacter sp. zg-Y916]
MKAAKPRHLPTSVEFAVWRAHIESFETARSRIESRLRRDSQLSDGDYRVLLALSEAEGKAMRSSRLAAHLEWERSRLSGQLGRMEKRGLLRREPSPEDARGSLVVLTDEGARAFRGSTLPHLAAIKEIFIDAFTPEQLANLEDAAAALRTHLGMPAR